VQEFQIGGTSLKASSPLATCEKREPLEQVHILLVLDERAMQRRNELFRIALAQRLGADILGQQELEPSRSSEVDGFFFIPGTSDLSLSENVGPAFLVYRPVFGRSP
jgi:hypothetical protein